MKITAGLGSIDEYVRYVEAGADGLRLRQPLQKRQPGGERRPAERRQPHGVLHPPGADDWRGRVRMPG